MRNQDSNAWMGRIEISVDNKASYRPMKCQDCTGSVDTTEIIVVDGNGDGEGDTKCLDGNVCTLYFDNAIDGGTDGDVTYVTLDASSRPSMEWKFNIEKAGDYMVSFRYSLSADRSTPLSTFINGVPFSREEKNPVIDVINIAKDPSPEYYPLQRCVGDCDRGECADGLVCFQWGDDETMEVPGCDMSNGISGWDYCADPNDYRSVYFSPTNSWVVTDPIQVALFSGENTIKLEVHQGQGSSTNIDHMIIYEASGGKSTRQILSSSASFRNPPQFMSKSSNKM